MEKIAKNIFEIKKILRKFGKIRLICVTKNRSADEIKSAIAAGISEIGENKIQEFLAKKKFLENEKIKTHFIGHLQKNKVRAAVENFDTIQSVDSAELAEKINFCAAKIGKKMEVFFQINISRDEKKFGFSPENFWKNCENLAQLKNLKIGGLMTILKLEKNPENSRQFFLEFKNFFEKIRARKIFLSENFCEISMGMSGDFSLAAECGATIVRIGRKIFS